MHEGSANMIGKTQSLSQQQRRTNPLSTASLPSVRLAAAIALGLAFTYAPVALHAQDANQNTTAASQATATGKSTGGKPADKNKAKDQKDVKDLPASQ
jgi:hypothetical protein